MTLICEWPVHCNQERSYESGEYCYYHFKLVIGLVSPIGVSKRPNLSKPLDLAGADPITLVGVDDPEERGGPTKKGEGTMPSGVLRLPRRP